MAGGFFLLACVAGKAQPSRTRSALYLCRIFDRSSGPALARAGRTHPQTVVGQSRPASPRADQRPLRWAFLRLSYSL